MSPPPDPSSAPGRPAPAPPAAPTSSVEGGNVALADGSGRGDASSAQASPAERPLPASADLRLVGPALAVWSAAFFLLPASPVLAYLTAALCGLPGLLLLVRTPRRSANPPFCSRRVAEGRREDSRVAEDLAEGRQEDSRVAESGAEEERVGEGRREAGRGVGSGGRGGGRFAGWAGRWGGRRDGRFAGRGLVGVVLVLGGASALGTGLRVESVRGGVVREAAERGASTVVEIVVKAEGRVTDKGTVVVEGRAVWVGIDGGTRVRTPVLVLARQGGWREVESGQRVRARGRLAVPERGELLGAVVLARGDPEVVREAGAARRTAMKVRDALREAVRELEPGARGVVPAMVLGDTAGIDAELKAEFERAGLVHCLVVSGANFSILVLVVLWTGRRAGLGDRMGTVLAGGVVLGFVLVVGTEPSVLRATVMGLIGLAAVCAGRERQGVPALAAAVVVLVLADPGLSRSYAFALSVTATSGLLLLAPRWRDRLTGAGLSRRLAETMAVPLAAQAAVGPILVLLAGTVSLVAVPANVLAAPAIAVATVCGFLTAALAPFLPDLAAVTVRPAGWAAGWVITVARTFAAVPHGTVPWHQGLLGALLLAVLTVAVTMAVRHRALRRLAAASLAGLALAALTFRLASPSWPPRDWRLVACDVGQGDALVLRAAPGQAVIVDAGPDPARIDGCLSRLSIRAVPLLLVTHPHADHLAGLPGITRSRPLATLVHTPLTPPDAQLRALHAAGLRPAVKGREAAGGVRLTGAAAGDRLRVGEVELEVLAPRLGREVPEGAGGTEVNNASLVLVARWPGLSVLLGGDLEEEGQRALHGLVPQVDVLKVPHHGSARQEPAFLAEGRPRVALISVGGDNDYGHPSERLLRMLHGIRVYRTDHHGDIAVSTPRGGLEIVTRS